MSMAPSMGLMATVSLVSVHGHEYTHGSCSGQCMGILSVCEGHLSSNEFPSVTLPCLDLSAGREKLSLVAGLVAEFSACCA